MKKTCLTIMALAAGLALGGLPAQAQTKLTAAASQVNILA